MFKITPNPTFPDDVEIYTPWGMATLKLEFKHLGKAKLIELDKAAQKQADIETLTQIVVGWSEVFDAEGNSLVFNADNLAKFIDDFPAAPFEIYQAYMKAATGARVKN